jgi:SHS2 domain-containing protein
VSGARGHRDVPHTADTRIEAWGPTREACLPGAVPKAVTLHELRFARSEAGWSCAVTIDV